MWKDVEPSINQACVSVFTLPVTLEHSFHHTSGHLFPKVREERYKGLEFISLSPCQTLVKPTLGLEY